MPTHYRTAKQGIGARCTTIGGTSENAIRVENICGKNFAERKFGGKIVVDFILKRIILDNLEFSIDYLFWFVRPLVETENIIATATVCPFSRKKWKQLTFILEKKENFGPFVLPVNSIQLKETEAEVCEFVSVRNKN